MPAKSKAQQRFMGMVHAYQKGELKNASSTVKKVAKSMDKSDAKKYASTKHKGKPEKVKQESVNEARGAASNKGAAVYINTFEKLLKKQMGSKFSKSSPSEKDIQRVLGLMRKRYGELESVNEGTKVYSMDVDDMVDVLSGWEKGVGGYSDGNAVMGKKLHGKKPEPFYNYAAGMHVSGGLKDALKALTKMWKKLDVKPSTTTKIFKAYHKLPDSKKKFSNPSFWEKFLEKNGISVVAESVNEGSISPTQAGKLFDKLLKKQTKGNLPSTKDIEIVFSLLRKKYGIKGESVNEGKYHTWRNDESLTPKQKIGRSMREIRDHLTEIDKLTKMNVRLKREMGVDSRDYWKNTHKALSKISERLVKLAKRVAEIY